MLDGSSPVSSDSTGSWIVLDDVPLCSVPSSSAASSQAKLLPLLVSSAPSPVGGVCFSRIDPGVELAYPIEPSDGMGSPSPSPSRSMLLVEGDVQPGDQSPLSRRAGLFIRVIPSTASIDGLIGSDARGSEKLPPQAGAVDGDEAPHGPSHRDSGTDENHAAAWGPIRGPSAAFLQPDGATADGKPLEETPEAVDPVAAADPSWSPGQCHSLCFMSQPEALGARVLVGCVWVVRAVAWTAAVTLARLLSLPLRFLWTGLDDATEVGSVLYLCAGCVSAGLFCSFGCEYIGLEAPCATEPYPAG